MELTHAVEFDVFFQEAPQRTPIIIKALVSAESNLDLIIGLPAFQCFDLFHMLRKKIMDAERLCDVCATPPRYGAINERTVLINTILSVGDFHP